MSRKPGTPQEVHINGNHSRGMQVSKISMSKKLFGWTTSSLKKSGKLVTDAVVLDQNDRNMGDSSSEQTQSNALSMSPLSPEMELSRYSDNQSMSVIRTNDSLVEPNTVNNALSLNNTQQNFYQSFSHINGLHIGTNVQINHNSSNNVAQTSDRRSNSGDIIQRTRSIEGKWFDYLRLSFHMFISTSVVFPLRSNDEIK